ncbi:MAG: histidine kinase [Pseudomonadota bacterium]
MNLLAQARRPYPYRALLKDSRFALGFNLFCALVVTYVIGDGRYFFENLVISMCIGTLAFLVIDGLRLLIWGTDRQPNWLWFSLIVIGAVPIAQYGGRALGFLLLGLSLSGVTSGRPMGMLLFTLIAAAGVTFYFYNRERLFQAEAVIAKERANAFQAQLQMLQAQIEPHMLFNTLANLQGLIAIDPARAQAMLEQLIQYLRATLSASRADSTTLGQEFALMDAYLGLMAVRMGPRLGYTLDLPDALRGRAIPPMLLQPLVENAIAHGLEPKIEGGHITISARADAGTLTLQVADTGRGPGAPAGKPGTGLGLSNTRARLDALFGKRAALTLEPGTPAGAIVRLTLPLTTP